MVAKSSCNKSKSNKIPFTKLFKFGLISRSSFTKKIFANFIHLQDSDRTIAYLSNDTCSLIVKGLVPEKWSHLNQVTARNYWHERRRRRLHVTPRDLREIVDFREIRRECSQMRQGVFSALTICSVGVLFYGSSPPNFQLPVISGTRSKGSRDFDSLHQCRRPSCFHCGAVTGLIDWGSIFGSGKGSAKMSGDGRLQSMEVDYSSTVDEKVPECEKLAKVNSTSCKISRFRRYLVSVKIWSIFQRRWPAKCKSFNQIIALNVC